MKRSLIAALLLAAVALAQNQPAFDAVSIKPADPGRPAGPTRFGATGVFTTERLPNLIYKAYDVENYQVTGGPAWVQAELYEVQAKTAASVTTPQLRIMLQSMLADRFHLKLHRETRLISGYILSIDKNGPKLPAPRADVRPDGGVLQMGRGEIWSRGGTITNLATGLRLVLGEPVVDETEIAGNYDLRLRFEAAGELGASVFTAIHDIGLRLDAKKIPIEVLVIDSVERPSDN